MPNARQTAPTDRVRLRRYHERGHYDRKTVLDILDAGLHCHVGFVQDGQPFVIPTLYWHDEERIYIHGSAASRMLRACDGQPMCITVSLIDGLVLARSAFHHSANYRAVTILGRGEVIEGPQASGAQLNRLVDRLFPGRWEKLRPLQPQELKATRVLSLSLAEASAKLRSGQTDEEEADLSWPVWAGVIPIETVARAPLPDRQPGAPEFDAPACAVLGDGR